MMGEVIVNTSRRDILKGLGAVGTSLVLGVQLPAKAMAETSAAGESAFAPNAFVRIGKDNIVTVVVKHIEFGQGPFTGLSTLVAEELDADWGQVRAEAAPANNQIYKNLAFGVQGTGGSTAIANSYEQMRKAGAAARAMLMTAAAKAWSVPPAEITIEKGVLMHKRSGKSGSFGDFADAASKLDVPRDVKLKDPKDFKLIGTDVARLDTKEKTTGQAVFTMDFKRPNMLTVVIARSPRFGGKVKSVDDTAARQVPGVIDVKTLPQGVAVYAEGYWPAKTGRDALKITWDDSAAENRSSGQILAEYKETAAKPGDIAAVRGDVEKAPDQNARTIEADFEFPFLAHAPMEPLDYVLEVGDGSAECWAGCQMPTIDQIAIAQVLGLRPESVKINTLLAGGSFGRRATPIGDVASEVAHAAKAIGAKRPVKVVWSREDDIQNGLFRPIFAHRLKGSVDADGKITHWDQIIVGQSIMEGTPFEQMMKDGIDPTMVEGAQDLPYAIPNFRVSVHKKKNGIPPLWWRSVGHTHTAYTTEVFIDELLAAAGKDPVEGRLELMGDNHPRHAGVLRAVAQKADWGGSVPEGRARGVALHKSFNSYVAQIAEVSANEDGEPRVHKVWCAVDCGVAVNPDIIRAQMEGGIGYGLGHALFGEITVNKGAVQQTNFDSYRSLRISDMPVVEVVVVKSAEPPTGVGEPGTPPVAPAVANAWAKLTGKRVRKLPFVSV